MKQNIEYQSTALPEKFPPSEPCSCDRCVSFCKRPGWWTVNEATKAIEAGLAGRMMLEVAPEMNFAVLSPAFRGNEVNYAMQFYSKQGCTFLIADRCELFDTGNQPLECRFCHHDREGEGIACHSALEKDWNSEQGKRLIVRWGNFTGFWQRNGFHLKEK
jgi:hypothetical protein